MKTFGAILCALVTVYMLYEAVTVPMIAAETPAILALGFGAAAYLLERSARQDQRRSAAAADGGGGS
jgi:hypothetical protein